MDFRARIIAELDANKARTQLQSLTKEQTVDLAVDVAIKNAKALDNLKTDAASLQKTLSKNFNIKIDNKQAMQAIKQVQSETVKAQKQLVKEQQQAAKQQRNLSSSYYKQLFDNQFNDRYTKSSELQKMADYYANMEKEALRMQQQTAKQQKNLSGVYYKQLFDNQFKDRHTKSSELQKMADYYANMEKEALKVQQQVQNIQKRVSQGFLDVDVSNVQKNLKKYAGVDSSTLKEVENSYQRLINLQKELQTGMNNGTGTKLSDTEFVDKYNQFSDVLQKCQNQMKVLSNEAGGLAKPFNSLDAITASNKTLTWLNNNTKAAKDYGDALEQLAAKQRSATSTSELQQYNKEFRNIVSEAQLAGKTGKSFVDDFGRAFGQIFQFAGAYGMIQNVIFDVPRQMVQAVQDINAAQIELRKVTDASDAQLTAYWDEAATSAQKYGAAINEVINSTADWQRLGYSFEESKELSDLTTLIQRVGDNMTQESSSEGLISTLQGFQLAADEAQKVVDITNEVANTQPIDTAGIFAGLQRSASSMSAANNTLEETIALITAGNAVLQDPERVGNGLKTISMRIRGATTELEAAGESTEGMAESTAALRKEVMALAGVDIMQDEDSFKSTYQILDELSTKWSDLTDIQQANSCLYVQKCA